MSEAKVLRAEKKKKAAPEEEARENHALAPPPALQIVPLYEIRRWEGNPRKTFDEEKLEELTASVREHGVLQPITVRKLAMEQITAEANGIRYEIVAGDRRFQAAQRAGLDRIPCVVRYHLSDCQALEMALTENDQRSDMTPLERAAAYKRLRDMGRTLKEIAEAVGCGLSTVGNLIDLLDLPEEVRQMIEGSALEVSHAKALRRWIKFPEVLTFIARKAIENKMSSHALEKARIPWHWGNELVSRGMAAHLNTHRHAFDVTAICVGGCPFGALLTDESGGHLCLNPAHAEELQQAAMEERERKRQEVLAEMGLTPGEAPVAMDAEDVGSLTVETVMEHLIDQENAASGPEGSSITTETPMPAPAVRTTLGPVDLSRLDFDAYANLAHYKEVAGCDASCSCRHRGLNARGEIVPICLNPERFKTLREVQEKAEKKALRAEIAAQVEAVRVLIASGEEEPWERAFALMAYHALRACYSDSLNKALKALDIPLDAQDIRGYQKSPEAILSILGKQRRGDLLLLVSHALVHQEQQERLSYEAARTPFTHFLLNAERTLAIEAETEEEVEEEGEPEDDVTIEFCSACGEAIADDLMGSPLLLRTESGAVLLESGVYGKADYGPFQHPHCVPPLLMEALRREAERAKPQQAEKERVSA